jgi:methyl-accepting chemotaxis protein
MIDSLLNKMKKGDFTGKIEDISKDEFGTISKSINKISHNIKDMGKEMNSLIEYMQNSSETFHKFSSELSSSSKKQFIQINEINKTIANLTDEISNSTKLAEDINSKSQKSLTTATESNNYVNEVIDDMIELTKSTRKIEDILKIIKEIAFQTNLLAHNASIEAARAGEQGKGFSVVAQSVSELAKKSADSTKEIEELIKNSINGLDQGTERVKNFGKNFQIIKTQLDETANQINDINKILRQQNEESYHVKESINRINKISQESSQKATMMEKNIDELKSKTTSLKTILSKNDFYDNGKDEKKIDKIQHITLRKDSING